MELTRVYIRKDNGEFPDDWLYYAYIGFYKINKGKNIYFFDDIKNVPVNPIYLIVSWIDDTLYYFEQISKLYSLNKIFFKIPLPLNIPDSIKKYTQRNIEICTMGDLRRSVKLPLFIKPYNKLKLFSSGVIKDKLSISFFNDISDEEEVLTSEVLDIVTEYRCFVINHEIVGMKHYNGDYSKIIDVDVVKKAIYDYIEQPISYTIDFGLTFDNKTVLIECNDAWSICNYGLDAETYARVLLARWQEIHLYYNKVSL